MIPLFPGRCFCTRPPRWPFSDGPRRPPFLFAVYPVARPLTLFLLFFFFFLGPQRAFLPFLLPHPVVEPVHAILGPSGRPFALRDRHFLILDGNLYPDSCGNLRPGISPPMATDSLSPDSRILTLQDRLQSQLPNFSLLSRRAPTRRLLPITPRPKHHQFFVFQAVFLRYPPFYPLFYLFPHRTSPIADGPRAANPSFFP